MKRLPVSGIFVIQNIIGIPVVGIVEDLDQGVVELGVGHDVPTGTDIVSVVCSWAQKHIQNLTDISVLLATDLYIYQVFKHHV